MKRIFSGIQPSGEIHIGNYVGAIQNWVKLLDSCDSIFCIVDYHAITVEYDVSRMQRNIREAAIVNIASGLDPSKCTLFVQSKVPEHTELTWIFNCVSPLGELMRMTQFKEKAKQHLRNVNVGLLDYPVLQAADILLYKADGVPVGEDQVQHIEFSREVARKFNHRYGETFPEPQALLTKSPRIMGLDGKTKMSKSLNNYIGLLEDGDVIWEKLRTALTDENRKRRNDPGNPDICNLFTLHQAFSTPEEIERINRECRTAEIGCVACKKNLFNNMMAHLEPIQKRAKELTKDQTYVDSVLAQGAKRCQEIAGEVMREVREVIGLK
ncbi:MAG: tryptophan--tRNA ligase [Gemmatimonadota bacterium]|nr:MAG: tryptophan--tRNA ligase [Gemmatimonadota bacterium]